MSNSLARRGFFCMATDMLYRVCMLISNSGFMSSAASIIRAKSVVTGRFPFSISFSCEGADTAKEFSADNIQGVNLVFAPGHAFDNLKSKASFVPVATRKAQAAALKAQKEGLTTADWTDPDDSGSGGGAEPEPEP